MIVIYALIMIMFFGLVMCAIKSAPESSDGKMRAILIDNIEYNKKIIMLDEGKTEIDAEYLTITLLLDDLARRENGAKGRKLVMDIVKHEYPRQLIDIVNYVAYTTGALIFKPEFIDKLKK